MPSPVPVPEPAAPKPRPWYRDFTVLQLAALVLILDQFTKYLVIELLSPGSSFPFRGFFRFTHVHNTGSAFGILQGLNTPLIFISFVGIGILILIYRSQPHPSNWLRFSLTLQLGGAFGNLIDRVRLGYVTDFIDVGPWPVFNLADASIVSGLIILAWVLTRNGSPNEKKEQREPEQREPEQREPKEREESAAPVVAGCHPASNQSASEGRENDMEHGSAVVPLRQTVEGNAHFPVVDLTGDGNRETPSMSVEDGDECSTQPERFC